MDNRIFLRKLLTTPNFFYEFADALDEAFPSGWTFFDEDILFYGDISGTIGLNQALKYACHRLHLEYCYEYYSKLDWYEPDGLDDLLLTILVSIVFDKHGNRTYPIK